MSVPAKSVSIPKSGTYPRTSIQPVCVFDSAGIVIACVAAASPTIAAAPVVVTFSDRGDRARGRSRDASYERTTAEARAEVAA